MQWCGMFAFYWYAIARTKELPLNEREKEIQMLEGLYNEPDVPPTWTKFTLILLALVAVVAIASVATAFAFAK